MKDTYKIVSRFDCCGVTMITVIINGKAACTMSEREYNWIMINERKFRRNNMLKVA